MDEQPELRPWEHRVIARLRAAQEAKRKAEVAKEAKAVAIDAVRSAELEYIAAVAEADRMATRIPTPPDGS